MERLKTLGRIRKERKLTQSELSASSGVAQTLISGIERDDRSMTSGAAQRLAPALGMAYPGEWVKLYLSHHAGLLDEYLEEEEPPSLVGALDLEGATQRVEQHERRRRKIADTREDLERLERNHQDLSAYHTGLIRAAVKELREKDLRELSAYLDALEELKPFLERLDREPTRAGRWRGQVLDGLENPWQAELPGIGTSHAKTPSDTPARSEEPSESAGRRGAQTPGSERMVS